MKKFTLSFALFFLAFVSINAQTLTYKDVAGIFYRRCTSCHHTGAHAYPWMNYTQVNASKSQIQFYLTNNIMPPWNADTTYTRFQHERLISSTEKQTILNWIATGAAKGDTTLAPPAPTYPPKYQLAGNADLTINTNYTSTASSGDVYVCISVPSNLTQDRIIRAYEVVPGNPGIIHHAVIQADSTGSYNSDLSGGCFSIPGNVALGSWAPGSRAQVFPSSGALKAGIRLKAGSKVILQLHYPAGTSGQVDSTKIRFYFYPIGETGVRELVTSTPLQNWGLNIPANQTKTFTATYSPTVSLSLFGIFPHSHKINRSMWIFAHSAGDTIPLIRINNWDFNWQDFYLYKNLVKIPVGYQIYSRHIYNNTTSNPNVITPVQVNAGFATSNEMLFDGVMALNYQPGDENIDVQAIIDLDTLYSGIKENITPVMNVHSIAYPNPFNNEITIRYAITQPAAVKVIITDVLGKQIAIFDQGKKERGTSDFIWNGKNSKGQDMPAGVYFYTVKAGDRSFKDKVIKQE